MMLQHEFDPETVCVTKHSTTSCSVLSVDSMFIFGIVFDKDEVASETWEVATIGSQTLKMILIVILEVQPVTYHQGVDKRKSRVTRYLSGG